MQFEKARNIAQSWSEKKAKNPELICNHDKIEKEYYLGAATGDYVCTTCGKEFNKEERDKH